MFQGVVHANARRILAGYARHLPARVHVIGSGNFSIETTLRANGCRGTITGCDVSLYSCALGSYLAGSDLPIALNAREFPELADLNAFVHEPESRAAAVAVALEALQFRKRDNAYKRRMYHAYLRRLGSLCEQTCLRLRKKRDLVRLDEFHALDGWRRVGEISPGPGDAVISFPPTYARGYERLYRDLHRAFLWDQPEYGELKGGAEFARHVVDRSGPWLLGAEKPTADFEQVVGRPIAVAPRGSGVDVWLYSNIPALGAKLIRRRVNAIRPDWPHLTDADEIASTSRLAVHRVSQQEAAYIRQVYGGVDVAGANAPFCYAVTVDAKLLGLLIFTADVRPRPAGVDVAARDGVYLMCDLAVSSERYRRLGKLVLMAARSREMCSELEHRLVRRVTWIATTAFSRHPESMKYRGVFRRFSRERSARGTFKLNYYALTGQQTLQEALDEWLKRFRKN
ncbi:MAG: hypothetical protein ACE5KM_08155 [Planctomycetaceae bacterium]